jgi:folate-binding protein YgfZ
MAHARELRWLTKTVGVLDLGDRSVISVTGDDAHEWLQGQLTNDCADKASGDSVYGFILTLKGRVLADAWAFFHDDGVWLDVPARQAEAVIERLDKYIIMEDVDLELSAELRWMTAQGPRADEVVEKTSWAADRLGVGGRQWLVPASELNDELERAGRAAKQRDGGWVSLDAWEFAHVVWGRPLFGRDFGEFTYPQETGLTKAAVSFTKGCYIGQETVVMLENRGKAPKVLWRWSIDAADAPGPKTPIERDGQHVGEITSAVVTGDGVVALGFLKRGQEEESEGFSVAGAPARPEGSVADHLRV